MRIEIFWPWASPRGPKSCNVLGMVDVQTFYFLSEGPLGRARGQGPNAIWSFFADFWYIYQGKKSFDHCTEVMTMYKDSEKGSFTKQIGSWEQETQMLQ